MEDLRSAIGAWIVDRDWEQFHSPKNLAMALREDTRIIPSCYLGRSRSDGERK